MTLAGMVPSMFAVVPIRPAQFGRLEVVLLELQSAAHGQVVVEIVGEVGDEVVERIVSSLRPEPDLRDRPDGRVGDVRCAISQERQPVLAPR